MPDDRKTKDAVGKTKDAVGKTSNAVAVPAQTHHVKFSEIEGMEGLEMDMLQIPRLKLLQALSEEVSEFSFPAGSFVNSVTKELVGDPAKGKDGVELEIVVVLIAPRTRIYLRGLDDGGGNLCRTIDGKTGVGEPGGNCKTCIHSQWSSDQPPACTDMINVFILAKGYDLPVPLSLGFGKTNNKAGRQLVNFLAMKQVNPWMFTYKVKSKFTEKDQYKYYTLQVSPAGKTSEEYQEIARTMYQLMKTTAYQVDYSDIENQAEQAQKKDVF